jgi:hypothetical protein
VKSFAIALNQWRRWLTPQHVRRGRFEVAIDTVERARRGFIRHRCFYRLAANNALYFDAFHQHFDGASRHFKALAIDLQPDFARAVDFEVL